MSGHIVKITLDDTDVDDFLMESRWIRYTYDFGDDWRHKIVYEKDRRIYSAIRRLKIC